MMDTLDVGRIYAESALGALGAHAPAPAAVTGLLRRAAMRLVDSRIVIEDDFTPFAKQPAPKITKPLPVLSAAPALADCIGRIRSEGFGPYARQFFGFLGFSLLELAGDDRQRQMVKKWASLGHMGTFCMTDAGGPLAQDWNSAFIDAAPSPSVRIDKIWAMQATAAGFLIAVVRHGQGPTLMITLVPPEQLVTLERSSCGMPFLDGALSLGNIRGTIPFDPQCAMVRGGPIGAKMFLAFARPNLIQALCAHVRYLGDQGRVHIDFACAERLEYLEAVAGAMARQATFNRSTEDEVMAVKLLANETWLELVVNGQVPSLGDQRDLLAFTRMEGSSYRCFFEIFLRNRKHRVRSGQGAAEQMAVSP